MESLENKEIEISCPECSNRFTIKLIQVAREEKVPCLICSKKIQLKDKDGKVRKSLEAFKKLGDSVKDININIKSSTRELPH